MRAINSADLKIEQTSVSDLIHYPHNAREHPESQLKMLEKSISKFGFNVPVLVSKTGVIIAGHGRLLAAERCGLKTVPAIRLPHLDEAGERAFRIADNGIALKGKWSAERLATEVRFLLDSDLDPMEIGFETGEIDFMLKPLGDDEDDESSDEVPEPDLATPPVSMFGDLWSVHKHKILHGNARVREHYGWLMGSDRARAVISDMLWNLPASFIGGGGQVKHRAFPEANGEMTREEFKQMIRETFALQAEFSCPGALNYQWIDFRSVQDMLAVGDEVYDKLINICVWAKIGPPGFGSPYRNNHELCCVFRVRGGKHVDNIKLGKFGRNRSNLWSFPSPKGFGPERETLKFHPTAKNRKMTGEIIKDCTDRGDIVLDAFLGSGTVALAAEDVGRIARGIELDGHYVDLAVKRLSEAVGATAYLSDGRSFDEVREARACGRD